MVVSFSTTTMRRSGSLLQEAQGGGEPDDAGTDDGDVGALDGGRAAPRRISCPHGTISGCCRRSAA